MTGQGVGRAESLLGSVSVELRSVNQRGLKLTIRLNETIAALEGRLEQLLRARIRRGAIHAAVRFLPAAGNDESKINLPLVTAYAAQLQRVGQTLEGPWTVDLAGLLALPGSVSTRAGDILDIDTLWPLVESAAIEATQQLDNMRLAEGGAMVAQLLQDTETTRRHLESVAALAPRVVVQYRQRLESKIRQILEQNQIAAPNIEILREVQLFADRSDISEELTRFASHLHRFAESIGDDDDASGRKLDFIIQEMFREANTIGSKANDSEISGHVVEIKCAIERMRELVQNLQ